MDTRQIPLIIMLIGGAVSCVASFLTKAPTRKMLLALLITLIVFYILGLIIRAVVEKNFDNVLHPEKHKQEEKAGEDSNESEDAQDKEGAAPKIEEEVKQESGEE